MSLLLIKIALTSFSIIILGYIADRGNPRLAGILTGFPIGTAIVASFIAIENGPLIASEASLYSLAALSLNPVFAYSYYIFGSKIAEDFNYKTTLSLALVIYFIMAIMIANIPWSFTAAVIFLLCTAIFVNYFLNKIESNQKQRPVKITPIILFVRIMLASNIVIIVTNMVELVGPEWAGVFTPFPVTLVPLIAILHSTYGKEAAFSMIKGFGYSFLSTGIYLASITHFFPTLGIITSSLIGFLLAGFYLVGLEVNKRSI
ncbi:hypothetical protein F9L33_11130 [Amylibacter sp. SFDW26]|uniref:hypothetical protein n=1 Tax=Amylibacter sp. SFDW26 TaxID=2652722 RepID=UPI00126277ED|nr:hypothetical protein [Amylibacter sp. SFDW26]KAB7613905.1 hypothetical protein F9L33_11130 [Amylibacter sp. SFDW26]